MKQKLLNLEPGDHVHYHALFDKIEQSEIQIETHNYYTDSNGFIEGWRIGDNAEIIINGLTAGTIIRKVDGLEEELRDM